MRNVLSVVIVVALVGCEFTRQRGMLEDDRTALVELRSQIVKDIASADAESQVSLVSTLTALSGDIERIDDHITTLNTMSVQRRAERIDTVIDTAANVAGNEGVGVFASAFGGPLVATGLAGLAALLKGWSARRKKGMVVV